MKLIKFTHYDTQWTADWKALMIRSEAKEVLVNLEFIVTVSPNPVVACDGSTRVNLHYVKTAIPNGRGINGDGSGHFGGCSGVGSLDCCCRIGYCCSGGIC